MAENTIHPCVHLLIHSWLNKTLNKRKFLSFPDVQVDGGPRIQRVCVGSEQRAGAVSERHQRPWYRVRSRQGCARPHQPRTLGTQAAAPVQKAAHTKWVSGFRGVLCFI